MAEISIITPTYNDFRTFKRCAKSLCNQNFQDFEWIIVDDGSNKTYHNMLQELSKSDSRITLLRNEGNKGTAYSRHLALKYCTSDYVTFLDSDDTLTKNALTDIVNYIKRNDADVYITNSYLSIPKLRFKHEYYKSSDYQISSIGECSGTDALLAMLSMNGVTSVLWDKVFKRELLVKYVGDVPDVVIGEDLIWLFRLLLHTKSVKFIGAYTYLWTYSGSGYKYYLLMWDEFASTMNKLCDEINISAIHNKNVLKRLGEALVDNYLYQLRESCVWRIIKKESKTNIIGFIKQALQHKVLNLSMKENYKPELILDEAYRHIRCHRKSYLFSWVLNWIYGG